MTYSTNDLNRIATAQAEHMLTNKRTVFGRMADEMDTLTAELNLSKDNNRPRSGDEDSQGRVFDPEIGEYV